MLAYSGLPATVAAPTYFYDNALGVLDEVAAGLLTMALPGDTPLQQVARQDLGRVVAEIVAIRTAERAANRGGGRRSHTGADGRGNRTGPGGGVASGRHRWRTCAPPAPTCSPCSATWRTPATRWAWPAAAQFPGVPWTSYARGRPPRNGRRPAGAPYPWKERPAPSGSPLPDSADPFRGRVTTPEQARSLAGRVLTRELRAGGPKPPSQIVGSPSNCGDRPAGLP